MEMNAKYTTGFSVGGGLTAKTITQTFKIFPPTPTEDKPLGNILFNVQKPIQTFTGRKQFLEDLHREIKESRVASCDSAKDLTQKPFRVISSTGGVGKTETVRMYIQEALKDGVYQHVIWFDAELHAVIETQIRELASFIKVPTIDSIDKARQDTSRPASSIIVDVYRKLCENQSSLLVVFDNAEALEDSVTNNIKGIKSFLPQISRQNSLDPIVLVTSRHQSWRLQRVIQLDLWTKGESVDFILRQLGLEITRENEKTGGKLAELFGCLPVALQAAVSLIIEQSELSKAVMEDYGIQDLLADYERGRREVLDEQPYDSHTPTPLMTLWNVTVNKIHQRPHGPLAVRLLAMMSYLSSTAIPFPLLSGLLSDEPDCDKPSLSRALVLLTSYSFIAHQDAVYRIHRMIQDVTVEKIKTKSMDACVLADQEGVLVSLSHQIVKYDKTLDEYDYKTAANYMHLAKHLKAELWRSEFEKCFKTIANVLHNIGKFCEALEMFEALLQEHDKQSGSDSSYVQNEVDLKTKIAEAYTGISSYDRAMEVYNQVLQVQIQCHGPEDQLRTKNSIAEIVEACGQPREALKAFGNILEGYRNAGMHTTTNAMKTRINMIRCSLALGEHEAALELRMRDSEEISVWLETTENMSCMLDYWETYADIAMSIGDYNSSLLQYVELFRGMREVFGNYDSGTLIVERKMADSFCKLKEFDQAKSIYLYILLGIEDQFDPSNPVILYTRNGLANALIYLDETEFAMGILEEVLEVRERLLGPEHPDTLQTKSSIACALQAQRKFDEALEAHREVLNILQPILSPNHSEILFTKLNMGLIYYQQGEFWKAFIVAQNICLKVFSIAWWFFQDFDDAIKLYYNSWNRFFTSGLDDPENHAGRVELFAKMNGLNSESAKLVLQAADWSFEGAKTLLCDALSHNRFQIGQETIARIPVSQGMKDTMDQDILKAFQANFAVTKYRLLSPGNPKERVVMSGPDTSKTSQTWEISSYAELMKARAEIKRMQVDPCDPTTSRDDLVEHFRGKTGVKSDVARFYLEASAWDMSAAFKLYLLSEKDRQYSIETHGDFDLMVWIEFVESRDEAIKLKKENLIWRGMCLEQIEKDNTSSSNFSANALLSHDKIVREVDAQQTEMSSVEEPGGAEPVEAQSSSAVRQNYSSPPAQIAPKAVCPAPITDIIVQCVDGKRLRGQFNDAQTFGDLYDFVNTNQPDLAKLNYVLTDRGNTYSRNNEVTLLEAGVYGALLRVKLI